MMPTHLLRRPTVWIAVAVFLGGLAFFVVRARGPRVHTVTPRWQDLDQHLVASGRVWVPTRVQVSAQAPGSVVAVLVREGQRVRSGELLVRMDDADARAALAKAKAAVEQARARVDQLRRVGAIVATEGLRQAQTNVERAEIDFNRTKTLAATGVVPLVDLDKARTSLELVRAQQTAAEAQQLASAPRGADARVVLTSLLQAQAEVTATEVRLAQTKLVALQDSVVLTRTVEPGDVVPASRTLLVLAAGTDAAQLVFQSDERNLASLRLGQKARASADAYPQQTFDADVSYIAPSIDPDRGSVEVRLRIAEPQKFLKPDMTVSIDITVAAKRHVLTLPSDAVRGAATPSPWLFTVENGRAAREVVSLGIRGEGTVEIVSSLSESARVILPDGQPLALHQRVRVARVGR